MSRQWNGKLLDNDRTGDSLAGIIMELVSLPCAVLTTAGAFYYVYSSDYGPLHYVAALFVGPITGLFAAAVIAMGAVALLVILALVILPFQMGYDRYFGTEESS